MAEAETEGVRLRLGTRRYGDLMLLQSADG